MNFLKSLGRILITAILAGVVGYLLIFNARLIMAAGYEAGYRAGQDACSMKTGVILDTTEIGYQDSIIRY